jgi:uncharacterized alkaline shock family protein YloU
MKKFSVWQKIQAILCFLVLLCVFAPLAFIAIQPGYASQLLTGILLDNVMGEAIVNITIIQRAIIGAFVLVGVLCSLRMLVIMMGKGKRDRAGVSMPNAPEGPIHISVPAVETLVSQGIRDVPGISDVRMKVSDYHDSISIELTMSARSDINIPETMMRLQSQIKSYVQENAGIEVRDVRLNVDKVLLADGIQALPAGRGNSKRAASKQEATQADYQPQSYTWKKDSEQPIVETKEAPKSEEKPAEKPQGVQADAADDDDEDADEEHHGWLGRLGHKKHDSKAESASSDVAETAESTSEKAADDKATEPAAEEPVKEATEETQKQEERAMEAEVVVVEAESDLAGCADALEAETESVIAESEIDASASEDVSTETEEAAHEETTSEEATTEEAAPVESEPAEVPDESAANDMPFETVQADEAVSDEEKPNAPIVIGDTSDDIKLSGDEEKETDGSDVILL